MTRDHARGFTLIELIAVLAVLSVLLAVVIPPYVGIDQKAKEAVCLADVKILQNAYVIYTSIEDGEIVKDHPDIVAFLTDKGLLHADSIPACPLEGSYFLEDQTVYCSIHTNPDTPSPTSLPSSDSSAAASAESSTEASSVLSSDLSADTPASVTPIEGYEEIRYTFTTSPYSGGFSYTLTFTNRSDEDISGWVAEFTYPGVITSCWAGELENLGDSRYRITCYDYNYFIEAGGSLSVTGQGTLHAGNTISHFSLNTTYQTIDAQAFFRITSQTGSSFQFEVLITNNGKQKITGWVLEFDYEGHIVRVWDARMVSGKSNRYRFMNPRYSNLSILPGQTLRFAGQGTTPPDTGPSKATLNGTAIPIS